MSDAVRDKVAIVGVGCCQFGENWDKSAEDMIVEAAYEAYADAGIEDPDKQIEAVFCGSVYPSRGTAEVAESLKLFNRPISLVQNPPSRPRARAGSPAERNPTPQHRQHRRGDAPRTS